ncbi:DUF4255 domain-containing protein [Paenibacillus sp. GD4]|nr:DUF4255 domain-containing protein [Paenibacillus chinjuensis]MDQ1909568.1 DUF4255 domain-containing protein [Paenibacillus sp. GD4]
MADYTVISDVGLTLVKLLREQLVPELIAAPESIGLASPADRGDLQLVLFLYQIHENAENRRTTMTGRGTEALQYPPQALNLSFLLTCYSASDVASRALDEQRIMGRVMQLLNDNSVLRGSQLHGSLADKSEELRISKDDLSAETVIGLFGDAPYKLSIGYTVGPVFLDSKRTKQTKRVTEARFTLEQQEGSGL